MGLGILKNVLKAFQASVSCFYTRSFISAELREIIKPLFYFYTLMPLLPLSIINCLPDVSSAQNDFEKELIY